tara:strand:- start:568 stop:870 length:303 start_codon:yes stop_codon:yes gene_type:complete
MLVIAKKLGEHPQGIWHNPGETFEFNGKKPALWMEAKDKTEAVDAEAVDNKDEAKGIHAVHRGAGKWDVFGADGKVIEGGDNLNKADAAALVKASATKAE